MSYHWILNGHLICSFLELISITIHSLIVKLGKIEVEQFRHNNKNIMG